MFWPVVYDAPRLHMAIHHALRQLADAGTDVPTAGELVAQARHIANWRELA